MSKIKAIMAWSGGKDSAMALYRVLQENIYEVKYLMCTVQQETNRVSMHGVRKEIIQAQADSVGISLVFTEVPASGQDAYEQAMKDQVAAFQSEGINHFIFGDIFLEDLRDYRVKKLAEVGAEAVFPLWQSETKTLIRDFLQLGFKTICCCAALAKLDADAVGRIIDEDWLLNLSEEVDPCGENGEFHSCIIAGPIFAQAIEVDIQGFTLKTYEHEGRKYEYGFVDILLAE